MKKVALYVVLALLGAAAVALFAIKFLAPEGNNGIGGIGKAGLTVFGGKVSDLSNKNLEQIPSYIFDQTYLEELNVSHNRLTGAIQSQIGQLVNLKVLNASDNQMTGVPAELGKLQNLEVLDLSDNKLTGLPNELGSLKKLKILNLSGNRYSVQDLDGIRAKLPPSVNVILR
jgi:Leucine-rich repeat (LRR) protein